MTIVASSSSELTTSGRQSVALEGRDAAWSPGCGWSRPAGVRVARASVSRLRNSPVHVKTVWAAVQRDPGLVKASFWRHQRDRVGRDIGRIGKQQVDPTSQRRRQWRHRGRLEVRRQRERSARFRRAHRTAAGSISVAYSSTPGSVDGQGSARAQPNRNTARQSLVAAERVSRACRSRSSVRRRGTKTPALDGNPQAGELGPPDDLLQRESGHPLPDHLFEFVRRGRRRQQHALPRPRRIHSQPAEAVRQAPARSGASVQPQISRPSRCSARNFSNSAAISSALGTRSGRSACSASYCCSRVATSS